MKIGCSDAAAGILLVAEADGWHSDFLADEGLSRGNPLTAAAPNVVEDTRIANASAIVSDTLGRFVPDLLCPDKIYT